MDEGSLMDQADSQFDFDGAGSGNTGDAGFGSGWEDDLESMLLKGMKKKAQRRIAIMVGVGTLGILLGALWGYGFASATQPDNAPVVVDGGANAWTACTDCEDCTPMHGHDYTGWALACSGIKCAGCFGGDGGCPHGCICTVTCDHYSGWDTNELVVGEDNLYLVTCDDGEWVGEEQCSPGSGSCKDSHGNETALCLNHDDCSPNPCQNGGICSDALHNHTCSCHPGFSGMDCEIDEDECNSNPCGIATPVTTVSSYTACLFNHFGSSGFARACSSLGLDAREATSDTACARCQCATLTAPVACTATMGRRWRGAMLRVGVDALLRP